MAGADAIASDGAVGQPARARGPAGGASRGSREQRDSCSSSRRCRFQRGRPLAGLDQGQQRCPRERSVCPAALSFAPVFLSRLAEKEALIRGSK